MDDIASSASPDGGNPIGIFSSIILDRYGADARAVIERQVEAATGASLATWRAILDRIYPTGECSR